MITLCSLNKDVYYYHYHYYWILQSFFPSAVIYPFESFSRQLLLIVLFWSLSDSKSPQVHRTLPSILAVFNNAVVWRVFTCPPTSQSPSSFNSPLVTVPNAPLTIGIIVTFMFHSFFNSRARSRYLSFFSLFSVLFCGQPGQQNLQF